MGNTYRPRWTAALAVSVPRGILAGTAGTLAGMLVALLFGDPGMAMGVPFLWPFITVGAIVAAAWQVRTRKLTMIDDGLVLIRARCQITVLWRDFEAVRLRRAGLVRLEEMIFRAGDVRALDAGAPLGTAMVAKFRRTGVDRRIQPALYLSDWRASPLGAACPA